MPSPAAFIDVRNARAVVSRQRGQSDSAWTLAPCANWEGLEALARAEVERQCGGVTLSGLYPCPPELAALALWPEDVLALVLTTAEAEQRYGLRRTTALAAIREGRLLARKSAGVWLVYAPDAARLWGKGEESGR